LHHDVAVTAHVGVTYSEYSRLQRINILWLFTSYGHVVAFASFKLVFSVNIILLICLEYIFPGCIICVKPIFVDSVCKLWLLFR